MASAPPSLPALRAELFASQERLLRARASASSAAAAAASLPPPPPPPLSASELRVLQDVAATGSYVHAWALLRPLLARRLREVALSFEREAAGQPACALQASDAAEALARCGCAWARRSLLLRRQ